MQKEYQKKVITGAEADVKNKVAEDSGGRQLLEFHFAGGLEYEPITITAATREEAEAQWEKVKKTIA